jgi:aspartate kinase
MNMDRITAKFGGSSLADAGQFCKVKKIVLADPRRKIVVVSAPGKRINSEAKLTDLLYLCHEMAIMNTDYTKPLALIRERFIGIAEALGLSRQVELEIDLFAKELVGCTRDYSASRGEYFSAKLMAEFLQGVFIDPADCIHIKANGTIHPSSYECLSSRMADPEQIYVMAGFYGHDSEGKVKTFSRGGSDISGAIAARSSGSIMYENWTDTSGMLMADPRIVEHPMPIEEISYKEVREMSYMGASVFHDEAILPVREAGIPICIKNTNRPLDPGTKIVSHLSPETIANTEIAGIAGKKHFSMICIEKLLMNKEMGFAHRLLGIIVISPFSILKTHTFQPNSCHK